MPHSTNRAGGPRGRRQIKQEATNNIGTSSAGVDTTGDDDASSQISHGRYPNHRSDAPTPSERPTEFEPLLREVRARSNVAPESPRNLDESFFHTSFQDIGKKLKACNDTLGELQQLGVSHDVQLPELVLVGDQSAGKSSLMSGLANLDLPRSEGTCTRCPLHIRVSRNTEWSCRVWLRKEYSYQPPDHPIHESDVTEQNPFFPWRKRANTEVHEFKTMHDKNEIEDVLRWAQIAILNDDKPFALFIPGSGSIATTAAIGKAAEETLAKFSPNIVALELKGPGLPDLSFYDMPGIFQNPADANDEYLVNVVRNLSSAYIQHPSAIIICSMPMNSDAENSSTFGLARKLGAKSRTIGVLTKADLLPDGGNHDQWLEIMKGKAHATGFGYFITSRPKDKDLEDLRKWEERMFQDDSYEKWPRAFHKFSDRCGVEKLKSFLSERLGEAFANGLPDITQKVQSHLGNITRQLANLPELPKNVELEVQTCLNNFADSSRTKIDSFPSHINNLPANFRDCLLEIKPKFVLKDRSDIPVVELSDDESDAASVMTTTNNATPTSKRRAMASQATPSKRPRLETNGSAIKHEDSANGNIFPPASATPVRRPVLAEPFAQFSEVGRGFRTLRQVGDEIQTKMVAGVPHLIPREVYNDLAMEAIRPWDRPTAVFLKQVVDLLHAELRAALDKAFEGLKKRVIYTEAKRHLKSCLDEHWEATQKSLHELYADETERLMTFNNEAFQQCIKDEKALLVRFRHHMRMQASGYAQAKAMVPWESLTEEKQAQETKRREAELAKIGPDKFEREVEVVAYVRGYYRLAALRYADAVSQRIICRMIPAIRRRLRNYLDEKLGVQGPDAASVYEKLMDEDAATAAKREMLKTERDKFEKAMASIASLQRGTTAREGVVSGSSFSQPTVVERQGSDATIENDMDPEEV